MAELASLFATSFVAATLVPLPSEAALFAYVHIRPHDTALAVTIATAGNTAGGMSSYLIGTLFPQRAHARMSPRAIQLVRRFGPAVTALAWLPVIGDALCVAAGWLRVNWIGAIGFMAAGRAVRYALVAAIST